MSEQGPSGSIAPWGQGRGPRPPRQGPARSVADWSAPTPEGLQAPAGEVVVPLAVRGKARLFVRGLLMLLLGGLAGVIFSAGIAAQTELPAVSRILVPLLGIPLGALGLWIGFVRLHAAVLGRARLVIHRDEVVVEHPLLFRSPLHIPRHLVRAVAIDTRTKIKHRIGERTRFTANERRRAGIGTASLYSSRRGSPVPVVGHSKDIPNLAILFTHEIPLDRARRGREILFTVIPEIAPAPGQKARGLLFNVEVPERAREVFHRWWGVTRPLTLDDVVAAAGGPVEVERRHRVARLAHLFVFTVFFLNVAIGLLLSPLVGAELEETADPTALLFGNACARIGPLLDEVQDEVRTPSGSDPGALDALLLTRPPAGFPAVAADEGTVTLDEAANMRVDPPVWRRELSRLGYVRGYGRRWNWIDRTFFVEVYEFPTQKAAFDFQRFAGQFACRYANEAFTIESVQGSLGLQTRMGGGGGLIDQVSFVRGNRRYLVGLGARGGPPDRIQLISLVEQAARIAR